MDDRAYHLTSRKQHVNHENIEVALSNSVSTMKMVLRVENLRDELALVYKKKFDRLDDEENLGKSRSSERITLFENYVDDLNEQVQMLISLLADSENKNKELSMRLKCTKHETFTMEQQIRKHLVDGGSKIPQNIKTPTIKSVPLSVSGRVEGDNNAFEQERVSNTTKTKKVASDTSVEIALINKKSDHSITESETNTVLAKRIKRDQQKLHSIKEELFTNETPLIKDLRFQILETATKVDALGDELAKALTNAKSLQTLITVAENPNDKLRLKEKLAKEQTRTDKIKDEMSILIHDSHMMESLITKIKKSEDVIKKKEGLTGSNESVQKNIKDINEMEKIQSQTEVLNSVQNLPHTTSYQLESFRNVIGRRCTSQTEGDTQLCEPEKEEQMKEGDTYEEPTSDRFVSLYRKSKFSWGQPNDKGDIFHNKEHPDGSPSTERGPDYYNVHMVEGVQNSVQNKIIRDDEASLATSKQHELLLDITKKRYETTNETDSTTGPLIIKNSRDRMSPSNVSKQVTAPENNFPQHFLSNGPRTVSESTFDSRSNVKENRIDLKNKSDKNYTNKASPRRSQQGIIHTNIPTVYHTTTNRIPTKDSLTMNKEGLPVTDLGGYFQTDVLKEKSSSYMPMSGNNHTKVSNVFNNGQKDANVKGKICTFIENQAELKHNQIKALLEKFGRSLTEFDHLQTKQHNENPSSSFYNGQGKSDKKELLTIKLEAKAKEIEFLKEEIENAEKEWDRMKNIVTALKKANSFEDEKKVVSLIDELMRTKTARVEYLESMVTEVAREVSFLQNELDKSPFKPDDTSYKQFNARLRVKLEVEVNRMRSLSSDLTSAAYESATLKSKFP